MLRINLLPPYIYDKQKKLQLWGLWAAILAIAVGGFLLWFVSLNTEFTKQHQDELTAVDFKSQWDKYETDINTEKKHRADIEARQDFIAAAQKYNDSWPTAFETMRDVTPASKDILLKSMSFDKSRKVVSFTGFAKDEATIMRWWEYLRNNYAGPDAALPFDNVSFSLPPHAYAPAAPAAAASESGPKSGGGMGVPSTAGASGGGMPSSAGSNRGGSGGGSASDAVGPGVVEGHTGINFVASVVLKKQLADGIPTPAWTGGAAPAAPAGFGNSSGRP